MNVLVADKLESSGLEGLKALGCRVAYDPALTPDQIGQACSRAEAKALIVRVSRKFPSEVTVELLADHASFKKGHQWVLSRAQLRPAVQAR